MLLNTIALLECESYNTATSLALACSTCALVARRSSARASSATFCAFEAEIFSYAF